VPIRQEAIKLLASDTRLNILKHLERRRMTVSELARALSLNKSTVHEHLAKLVEGGLIKRDESEEREFVYYELTRTAHYVLQPASARFVLLMGTFIAAGLFGLLLLQLALTANAGLAMHVGEPIVPAGEAALWTAEVSQPGVLGLRQPAEQAQLFLLDADQAADFQLTGQLPPDAHAVPGVQHPAPGSYAFRAALDPGVHYLLARQPGLPDALLPLRAQPVEVVPEKPTLLAGVDAPRVSVDVRFRGAPVEGGLVQAVDAETGRELAQVPVLNGKAVLDLGEAADKVAFRFKAAEPGSSYAPAEGELQAPEPHVAFGPALLALGVRTDVRVVVDDPLQGPRAGAPLSLIGQDGKAVARATTDTTGAGKLGVRPRETGEFVIKAGQVEVGRVLVQPGLRLWVEPGPHWEGDEVRVRALELGKEPNAVQKAAILLDGREVGLTGADGWLPLQFAFGGSYHVEVRREGWVPAETSLEVLPRTGYVLDGVVHVGLASAGPAGPAAPEPAPQPHLEAPARLAVGEGGQVRALLRNDDPLPRVLRAELREDGRLVEVQAVRAPAGEAAWVAFAYAPAQPGTHQLQVNQLPPQAVMAYQAQAVDAVGVDYASVPGLDLGLLLPVLAGAAFVVGRRRA
jgi:DNA-binding transcriptional ArsR family regulator